MLIKEAKKILNDSGYILVEGNEVAGSYDNLSIIAETIVDNIELGNDGKPANVWISGGAVRDELIGRPCSDIDLFTNCDSHDVADLFEKSEIAHVGNGKIVRIWMNGDLFELGCLNKDSDVIDNLDTRDLTCNAILKNVLTNKFYDPLGGIEDIKNKELKFTTKAQNLISSGKDPSELFRAFRFMSQLGWDFSPETEQAIKSYSKINNGKIKVKLSAATAPAEWRKLSNGKYKDKAFNALEKFGFMDWVNQSFGDM